MIYECIYTVLMLQKCQRDMTVRAEDQGTRLSYKQC